MSWAKVGRGRIHLSSWLITTNRCYLSWWDVEIVSDQDRPVNNAISFEVLRRFDMSWCTRCEKQWVQNGRNESISLAL